MVCGGQEAGTAVKLQTMLLAMADVRAVLVVLASKLQRLRASAAAAASGAGDLRLEATEGLRVFAPLANRLGVWSLKAELEDLCFLVRHDILKHSWFVLDVVRMQHRTHAVSRTNLSHLANPKHLLQEALNSHIDNLS